MVVAAVWAAAIPAAAGPPTTISGSRTHAEEISSQDVNTLFKRACADRDRRCRTDLAAMRALYADTRDRLGAFPGGPTTFVALTLATFVDDQGRKVFPSMAVSLPVIMRLAATASGRGAAADSAATALVRFTRLIIELDVGALPPPGDWREIGFIGHLLTVPA